MRKAPMLPEAAGAEDSDEGGMHEYADIDDPDGNKPTLSVADSTSEYGNAEIIAAATFQVQVEDVYDDADIEEDLYVEDDEPAAPEPPLPLPPRSKVDDETCDGFGTDYHGDAETFGDDFDEEDEYAEMVH
eukprot:m.1649447 g.1649447  ORF g.1649447 m.1649447 type:complete len:131 (-) comp82923_c0_seq1:52-444(-)